MIQSYSNQNFDRAQQLAQKLTDADRAAGRPAPTYGYSLGNFELAEDTVAKCETEEDLVAATERLLALQVEYA